MNPWDNEPNFKMFQYKDSICIIRRVTNLGHLCGYITLNKRQAKRYKKIDKISVHGGITYHEDLKDSIHKFEDMFSKYKSEMILLSHYALFTNFVSMIGIDCAHSGDILPYQERLDNFSTDLMGLNNLESNMLKQIMELGKDIKSLSLGNNGDTEATYKTIEFVEAELKSLVDQLEQ